MLRASTLGLLGRVEDADRFVQLLFSLKPDFPSRGRALIKFWAKPEELVARIIRGLKKAGMDLG
ncbi:uncharacterized protein Dvar_03290 [Desulfosarcina variabilis str. Montpellier]